MSDYIKREDAINAIIDAVATYKPASIRISEIPPADVRENVRGEWIEITNETEEWYWHPSKCSICGAEMLLSFDKFCPNCGADMRQMVESDMRGEKQ